MEIDLDTGKLYVFICGLILFFVIESIFPKRDWEGMRLKRTFVHSSFAVINTVIIRLFIYVPFLLWVVYVEEEGWGISRWLQLTGWTEIILSIIVLDLFDYFWHRANHQINFLWRFHKAHHSDTHMDVTTALRFHPGELIISSLVKASWILIWGPSVIAWFIFEAMVSLSAQFHHSNIDFPNKIEKWLSVIIVTPRFHTSHHLVSRVYGNANYSTIFSVWDKIFNSYFQSGLNEAKQFDDKIGLPEDRNLAFSWRAWISEPFSHRNLNL